MKYNAKRGFLMSGKKKIIAAVCAASVVCLAAVVTEFAVLSGDGPFTGKVTDDAGNGIANVSVTDGRNVVKTDANGAFTLKGFRKSHFVTVTVPAGYQAKTYYLPIEKDRQSYDFVLTESELTGQTAHSFLQISDIEIGAGGTGDICYEDDLKRHIQDMNTDTMGCTVYYTIGNHDYVDGAIAFTAPYIGKGAQTVESTPVINGDEVIFGASDGYIYCVEKTSGKILQKYDAGSPVFGKVIVSGSSLIAGTLDGKVVCFS